MIMPDVDQSHLIYLGLFLWVSFLVMTVKISSSKGRSQAFWLVAVGAFPAAFLILLLMPVSRLRVNASSVVNYGTVEEDEEFLRRCRFCNNLTDASKPVCSVCGR